MKFLIFFLLCPFALIADAIPRHVIAFWDSVVDLTVDDCLVHRTVEMPLNHLGLDVVYYDIQKPLPDLSPQDGIRGIILCFQGSTKMPDPKAFIEWAIDGVDKGKKIVIMRNPGFLADSKGNYTSGDLQNRLFEKIGFTNTQEWIEYPFDYQIISAGKELFPFEKQYPNPLPGFYITRAYEAAAKAYLKVSLPDKPESQADPVIIGPHGAYVSEFFANTYDNLLYTSSPRSLGWYFDPFRFFEIVFDLAHLPIPDATTLAGRRIYTSTCHGDNWNTETAIEEYRGKNIYCAEVILEKIIKTNPDLPIAVGIVAADVDPTWVAKNKSQKIARDYLALPQVEAASHTYSHPFYWDFFRTGGPEKEIDYLHLYPYGTWQNSYLSWARAKYYQVFNPTEFAKRKLKWGYVIPRAYANKPFELANEISGAIDYINQFAPPNNKINLLIWPGDSRPWDVPVILCDKLGIKTYGGGFVRFDPDFPSYLFVYPLGRKPGGLIQLYASSNAENNYTHGWKDHFYGFQYLPATLKNTESPKRIKPINLYYHSFSGEFQSSVDAVLSNLAFIRTQSIIPIRTTRFCEIGEGFYSTAIEPLGVDKWKIRNRKGLQTIRFDNAQNLTLNFSDCLGVIGCLAYQGSLYIHLDAAYEEPIVAIKQGTDATAAAHDIPYLLDSDWEIWDLKREGQSISFSAKGWGKLSMRWRMPSAGDYSIAVADLPSKKFTADEKNIVTVELELPYNRAIQLTMSRS